MGNNTLEKLINEYVLPINVKKDWWYGDYYFRVEVVNSNGMASGTIYRNGNEYGKKSYSLNEEMILFGTSNVHKPQYMTRNSTKMYTNGLSGKQIYRETILFPGRTVLYLVKHKREYKKTVVLRFEIKNGLKVIYVNDGSRDSFFRYPECMGRYLFLSEAEAKSFIAKQSTVENTVSTRSAKTDRPKPTVLSSEGDALTGNYDEDQQSLNEEKRNLAIMESRLDELIGGEDHRYQELKAQISDYKTWDWKDVDNKKSLKEEAELYRKQIDKYRSYKPRPYFGRLDMSCNDGSPVTYFVGENGLTDKTTTVILDWRSPLGGTYYIKREKEYSISGYSYRLLLRRAIEIQNAKLINVNTEYDGEAVSLDGEVIDPFLRSVLRDKRRDYRLTDIIRTIQGNQNEIIRKPIDESFILQGCAGSGKTMILLHRLSYLAYNYPKTDYTKYCILTPNEYFDSHINELSIKLGLDKIKRYTVEAYYAELIRRLSSADVQVQLQNDRRVMIPSIGVISATVVSEKSLNQELLTEVYSEEFQQLLVSLYHQKWTQVEELIKSSEVEGLIKYCNKKLPDLTNHTFPTYQRLVAVLSESAGSIRRDLDDYNLAVRTLLDIVKRLNKAIAYYQEALEHTAIAKEDALNTIRLRYSELHSTEKDLQKQSDETKDKISELIGRQKEIESGIDSDVVDDKDLEVSDAVLSQFSYISKGNSPIVEFIKKHCQDTYEKIIVVQSNYERVARYNFGKRAALGRELENLKVSFSLEAQKAIQIYRSQVVSKIEAQRKQVQDISFEITQNSDELETIASQLTRIKPLAESWLVAEKALLSEDFPDMSRALTNVQYAQAKDDLAEYTNQLKQLKSSRATIESLQKGKERLEEKIEAFDTSKVQSDTIEKIEHLKSVANEVSMASIREMLNEQLMALYEKYGEAYKAEINYRHKLYLLLVICSLYYPKDKSLEQFVNIDEAQDIAISEYKVIRAILGDACVFNLYGDVNQLVYEYKGISDWDELSSIVSDKLYFLNENYRNTLQITEYCNHEFGADIVAVGLSGEKVQELPISEAVIALQNYIKCNPEARAAIIYRKGAVDLSKIVEFSALKGMVVWDTVETQKISAITVELAKGLEFEAVVIVSDGMNVNEKYISYTRALDNLIVSSLS